MRLSSNSNGPLFHPHPGPPLQEEVEHQEAYRYETSHDNAVPLFSRRYSPNERVNPGHLARGKCDPTVDIIQCLPLQSEAFLNRVCLREHRVGHAVAIVDMPTLVQHVLGLSVGWVLITIGLNVVADIGKEVCAVPCVGEVRF